VLLVYWNVLSLSFSVALLLLFFGDFLCVALHCVALRSSEFSGPSRQTSQLSINRKFPYRYNRERVILILVVAVVVVVVADLVLASYWYYRERMILVIVVKAVVVAVADLVLVSYWYYRERMILVIVVKAVVVAVADLVLAVGGGDAFSVRVRVRGAFLFGNHPVVVCGPS